MKNLILLYCCIQTVFSTAYAQINLTGNAEARIDSLINSMPASPYTDEYQPLNMQQEIIWAHIIDDILIGDITSADARAKETGYGIIVLTDTTSLPPATYYFLEKDPDSLNYWGTLVFNPNPLRSKLIIQAPHPLADTYTGRQAFDLFKSSGAYLYCVSGAHRCNSSEASNCSGLTSVCIGLNNASYRKSDQAHNVESVFQVTTEVLLKFNPEFIFIQPHGFTREPGDPDLILSNGTRYTPRYDYLKALRDTMLQMNPLLQFRITHLDWTWFKLTGTTNTQGRLINGSPDPCYINSSSVTGKFLHIEQAPYLRFPKNWHLLNEALKKVFPADPFLCNLAYMRTEIEGNYIVVEWETMEETGNYGFELQKYNGSENGWTYTAFISSCGAPYIYKYTDKFTPDDTILYRLKQINIDGSYKILSPVAVNLITPASIVLYDNYPNPFNSSTIISFVLPEAGKADLSVYNTLGEKITTLISGELTGGNHRLTFNGDSFSAGVYFYKLTTPAFSQTKKLVLLK